MSKDLETSTSANVVSAGTPEGPREINVDELEVNILMIVKNPSSVQSAAQFLSRRGWPTKMVGDLSQAIQVISKEKPDLILISINHPSPKILKMPTIIAAGFKSSTCVLFSEITDAKSVSMLGASKHPYKLSGGASGPNLHRGIRKILNQIFNPTLDTSEPKTEGDGKANGTTRIAGSDSTDGQGNVRIAGDGATDSVQSNSYTLEAKRTKKKLRDLSAERGSSLFVPTSDGQNDSPSAADMLKMLQAGDDAPDASYGGVIGGGSEQPGAGGGNENKRRGIFDLWSGGSDKKSLTKSKKALEKLSAKSVAELPKKRERPLTSGKISTEKSEVNPQEVSADMKASLKEATAQFFKANAENLTADYISSLAVVMVQSKGYQGFIVAGLNATAFLEELSKNFKTEIEKQLAGQGDLKIIADFPLEVGPMNFNAWLESEADYALRVTHEELTTDVGAFSYDMDCALKPESRQDRMLSIDISKIDTGADVPFKAYLNLKRNGKFYRYLNAGRKIQDKQKIRLTEKNVDVRISEEDLSLFRAYCLTLEIKTRIQKFATNKESAASF